MVYCRFYRAAAGSAAQQTQWKNALLNEKANQEAAGRLYVPATVSTFDGAYKWGANWHFAVFAEFRFNSANSAEADAQWNRAMTLMQGGGQVGAADTFAERWDQAADDPAADQSRLNYQSVSL